MRKINLCFLITLLALGLAAAGLTAPGASAQPALRWNYPCKPGTECWNALTNVAERQDACQIKGIDLGTLSTEELLLITMEHPFFRSYVFSDSPLAGVSYALNEFNGFAELISRKDAMATIRDVYAREDFSKVRQMQDSVQIGEYTLKWTGVELIMANQILITQLSGKEELEFLKTIHEKLLVKEKLPVFFSGTSLAASALIYHKITQRMGNAVPSDVVTTQGFDLFETLLIVTEPGIVKSLLTHFKKFIKDNQ